MGSVPPLLSFLLMIAAGWVHRHQLIVIEYLQAENRLLKDRLRRKRIRLTDAERALLARKAKAVGRKALLELETIVSPDTLLRWHRRLIAEKWNFVHRRGPGRPGIMQEISALIVGMAQDNPGWGYTRIQGALANLGHLSTRSAQPAKASRLVEGPFHGQAWSREHYNEQNYALIRISSECRWSFLLPSASSRETCSRHRRCRESEPTR